MTDLTYYLPLFNIFKPHPPPGVQRILAKLPTHQTYNANLGIIWTTAGASAAIYLVWQYINRSPTQLLGNPIYWSSLDYLIDRLTHAPPGTLDLPNPPTFTQLLNPRYLLYSSNNTPVYHGTRSQTLRARLRTFMTDNFVFHFGDGSRRPWTIVTSCLSHQDWRHLTANLTAFLEFGRVLARRDQMLQPSTLLALMACCALGGKLGFVMQQSLRQLRRKTKKQQQQQQQHRTADGNATGSESAPSPDEPRMLGLSAVVQGLGVAVTCMYPWTMVAPMGAVRLPLWLATSIYLLVDLCSVTDGESTVGHAAHLGGALTGYCFWNVVLR